MTLCKHGVPIRCFQCSEDKSNDAGSESGLNAWLCLWIHGTAGETEKPCDEVDVIQFTGSRIPIEFIESVMKEVDDMTIISHLEDLPTERWLDVMVKPVSEEDGWSFSVIDYKERDI